MKRLLILVTLVALSVGVGALLGWRLSSDEPRRGGALTLAPAPSTPVVWTKYGSGEVVLDDPAEGFKTLPGLSDTVSVPEGARVYLAAHGGAATTSEVAPEAFASIEVSLFIDSQKVPGFFSYLTPRWSSNDVGSPLGYENWSISGHPALAAGTHTVAVKARLLGGSDAFVSGSTQSFAQMRGALTVMVLRP